MSLSILDHSWTPTIANTIFGQTPTRNMVYVYVFFFSLTYLFQLIIAYI